MNLDYIRAKACPICNADVVSESCERRHANGQGFEKRRFSCGMELAWSPNFERLETAQGCPADPHTIRRKANRASAKASVLQHIDHMEGVDAEFRALLRERIVYA